MSAVTLEDLTQDVPVLSRSRTFSEDTAQAVLHMLKGEKVTTAEDGSETVESVAPARNVGYGTFKTAGAARSAGVTLNRMLQELGAPHAYAVTTRERDGKHVGIIVNKPAKRKATDETPAAETPTDTPETPAADTPTDTPETPAETPAAEDTPEDTGNTPRRRSRR